MHNNAWPVWESKPGLANSWLLCGFYQRMSYPAAGYMTNIMSCQINNVIFFVSSSETFWWAAGRTVLLATSSPCPKLNCGGPCLSWVHVIVCRSFQHGQLVERQRVHLWSGRSEVQIWSGSNWTQCCQRLVTAVTFFAKKLCVSRAQWLEDWSCRLVTRFGVMQRV